VCFRRSRLGWSILGAAVSPDHPSLRARAPSLDRIQPSYAVSHPADARHMALRVRNTAFSKKDPVNSAFPNGAGATCSQAHLTVQACSFDTYLEHPQRSIEAGERSKAARCSQRLVRQRLKQPEVQRGSHAHRWHPVSATATSPGIVAALPSAPGPCAFPIPRPEVHTLSSMQTHTQCFD
jgi:hypothetical protein